MAIIISIIHQLCLSLGLSSYIRSPFRAGFLAANKEGILSIPGYVAIFLIFIDLGKRFFDPK